MSQNKSVEEVVEEFNDRSNDRMFMEDECRNSFWFEEGEDIRYDQDEASKWLVKEFKKIITDLKDELRDVKIGHKQLTELIKQERQTSQEREREIVEAMLKKEVSMLFPKNDISYSFKGVRTSDIKTIAQKYNITLTNPNKD